MMLADIGGKEIRCMEKGVGDMVAHAEWLPARCETEAFSATCTVGL